MPKPNRSTPASASRRAAEPPEEVDPRWIAKAVAVVVAAAFVCGYLAICLLVYLGSWQSILHPVSKVDLTPASSSIPFDAVRFDAAATGTPRLSAWWIPAAQPSAAPARTILYLHDGSGSLSQTLPAIALLHQANVNILDFDYRGFGQSAPPHPTEERMSEDAEAGLDYLLNTRHLSASSIVPCGTGLGAALAAALAAKHPELPAVILDNPVPQAVVESQQTQRSRFLPVGLLIRDHFEIEAPLARLKQPKLLIAGGPNARVSAAAETHNPLLGVAPDPKMTVTLAGSNDQQAYAESVQRFLDEYVRP